MPLRDVAPHARGQWLAHVAERPLLTLVDVLRNATRERDCVDAAVRVQRRGEHQLLRQRREAVLFLVLVVMSVVAMVVAIVMVMAMLVRAVLVLRRQVDD